MCVCERGPFNGLVLVRIALEIRSHNTADNKTQANKNNNKTEERQSARNRKREGHPKSRKKY